MGTTQKLADKSFTKMVNVGQRVSVSSLIEEIKADLPFFDESGGGVTFSGGEPLAQPEFALALLKECKSIGVHTALDTCGYADTNTVKGTIQHTDLYLFDLKLADTNEHKKFTGVNNELIISNLQLLSKSGAKLIIRVPLVKGITDTQSNIEGIMRIIDDVKGIERIDLLRYHTLAKHKFSQCNREYQLSDLENYPLERAEKIKYDFKNYAPIVSIGG